MIPLLFIILFSVTITGVINRTRAVLAGRKGYRFFQTQFDVEVLLKKASVYSNTSTFITQFASSIYLATIIGAALCVPMGLFGAVLQFKGDIIFFSFMLAFSRIVLVLAAMDSGSSFQGMGASREIRFGMLAEPAFFLLVATLALITGKYSFSEIFAQFDNMSLNLLIISAVVGFGLFKLALSECSRVPVDDSRTHLELTMIHEAMVLDFSGVDLAFVQIGGWIKLAIFGMLFANALIPAHVVGWVLVLFFVGVVASYGVLIGVIESIRSKNKMSKNNIYLVTIFAVGLLAVIVAFLFKTNTLY